MLSQHGAGIPCQPLLHYSNEATRPILAQIDAAFRHPPSVANTLHGVRRIHQGARGRSTSLFPSRKSGGAIPLESKLELAYAVLLERSPVVLRYRTQAVHIPLPAGQSAFPDFLVELVAGGFEVHEVKPSIAHLSRAYLDRCELISSVLQPAQVAFRLVDAMQLPNRKHLEWLLQRYVRGHLQMWTRAQVQLGAEVLTGSQPASLAQAHHHLIEAGLPVQLADYLAFHRHWYAPEEVELEGMQ
ncbi:hypothetical protein N8I74_09405 [Chitiniphilus purpureus]|uniref:TnsA endonuclease N-terminal domain-containing protein n=1 Tax=Chitiniphilus purpureus TaxID=2981137 RepID=A0ABY6DZD7_9NEIS|nr:hypothetical protein [Chitiniphilus sp. CD1]UXY17203.1 hypothetical protein N8I74_09405 [Chitiniphilus sp. CD1]